MKDLNAKPETIKLLEENICNMLFDIGLSNFFFFFDLICQARTKSKTKQMGQHKTERFYINEAKRSLTECDNLFLIRGNIQNTQRTHTTQHRKTKIKSEQRA